MRSILTPKRIADDQLEITVESPAIAQALAGAIRDMDLAEDVVAGLSSVCIRVHPSHASDVEKHLAEYSGEALSAPESRDLIEVHIRYGGENGPDLDLICTSLSLASDAFIEMHTSCEHRVEMIGFTPGFAYISGLPDSVKIPRLSQPRPRVAAGSVGISADFTGLYALAGPGGWPLIGRTEDQLFDASSDKPFRLSPGHRVKFKAV